DVAAPGDGVEACAGVRAALDTSCDDSGADVVNGVEVRYGVWAIDDDGLVSASPATVQATPRDETPPSLTVAVEAPTDEQRGLLRVAYTATTTADWVGTALSVHTAAIDADNFDSHIVITLQGAVDLTGDAEVPGNIEERTQYFVAVRVLD